ncbi:MAG: CBS domain-containing protein [Kiritimatiellae bacterium]|nr:CBS domain-containing protein [Kiritimatiellia bacterium]
MKIRHVLEVKGGFDVFTIPPETTLREAVRIACEKNIGALVVADADGKLKGILSERDVMRQCNAGTDFDKTPVSAVMATNLITSTLDDDIHLAMDMMNQKKIRHLPVLEGDKIRGIITIRDLILAIRKADEVESKMILAYIRGDLKLP